MSFFKKLKDRLFKSSSKIDEGLEAIVQEAADEAPAKQDREEAQVLRDSIDSQKIIEDLPPEIGRAHVRTPVTSQSRMPSSA